MRIAARCVAVWVLGLLPQELRWRQTQIAYERWASHPLPKEYLDFIRERGRMFAEFVGEPGSLVDVGCGNGLIGGMTYAQSEYVPLRKGKYRIYGIDPLPLKAPIPWIHFYEQMKCEDIDCSLIHVETATFITTFDHLEDPALCLRKLRRVGVRRIYLWETLWLRPVPGDVDHARRHTLPQLEALLGETGFKVIRRVRVDVFYDAEGWFIEAEIR